MFDRSLVTSGFDTETLVSEQYIKYLLLAQIEAGRFPLQFPVIDPANDVDITVLLHPPTDYERLYEASPDAPLPDANSTSFEVEFLPGNVSPIRDIAYSPSGDQLITRSIDDSIRFWDAETGAQDLAASFRVVPALGSAIDLAATRIAIGSSDRKVRILNLQSKLLETELDGHTLAVEAVVFSNDGLQVASGSFDQTVRVWDVASGDNTRTFLGHSDRVLAVCFSADGTRLVSGSADGDVRLWDVQSGDEIHLLSGHAGPVRTVAFSPDGTRIASGSDDRSVRLWDPLTGVEIQRLDQHEAAVLDVEFNVDGTRLASAGRDNTVRIWNTTNFLEQAVMEDHRSAVNRVRFRSDGLQLASASEGGKIRRWDGVGGSVTREIRVEFMRITIVATIVQNATGQPFPIPIPASFIANLDIDADRSANGLESNHRLRLTLGRLDLDQIVQNLLDGFGVDPQIIEDALRIELDRSVPLGVAQGQQVQQIRMQKYSRPDPEGVGEEIRSLGLYVDLALLEGDAPGTFVEARGRLFAAQDFREKDSPISFASSPQLFDLLGPDLKLRQAEETEVGSGEYKFPLREDPLNPDSDKIGKIKNIKVRPEKIMDVETGRLEINLHGEYTEAPGDPDFDLQLLFKPKIDDDGIVEWDVDVDVDFGLLATFVLIAAGIVLTVFFGGIALGWVSTFMIGIITGVAVLKELIAEPYASKVVEDRLDGEAQASILDALPFRLPAARRRWDPFYTTVHQIVAKFEEPVIIDSDGIAFVSNNIALGREPQAEGHIVIRDEERTGGNVSALRYRVRDFLGIESDLVATAPGVDRRDFTRSDPGNDPTLVSLTPAQIVSRKAENRIHAPVTLIAKRIHLVNNQIDQLLCINRREINERRDALIRAHRTGVRNQIISDLFDDIVDEITQNLELELGRAPTDAEINAQFESAVDDRLDVVIDELREIYEADELPSDLEDAIAGILRFDLAPEEMIVLQEQGILFLDEKEIIVRHNADGSVTPYYRDHPDGSIADNLLELPSYIPPYEPPQ